MQRQPGWYVHQPEIVAMKPLLVEHHREFDLVTWKYPPPLWEVSSTLGLGSGVLHHPQLYIST